MRPLKQYQPKIRAATLQKKNARFLSYLITVFSDIFDENQIQF